MRLTLLTLLLVAGATAAQPGPAPGYGAATDYAMDYAAQEIQAVKADPSGYAEDKTAPGAVDAEVTHTVYMACWAADDAGLEPAACEPYYTPRGQEHAPQQAVNMSADEIAADAQAFAQDTETFVHDVAQEPEKAPEHAMTFLEAAQAFALATVQHVSDLVRGVADDVVLLIGGAGDALEAAVGDLEATGSAVADAADLGAITMLDGMESTGTAIATSANVLGQAAQDAGHATADALSDAGHAIADAARSVRDAVTGLFSEAPSADPVDETLGDALDLPEDRLLDGVTELLP